MGVLTVLPCQKYLLRHLKTNDDLLVFAKVLFFFCEEHGMNMEEAVCKYEAALLSPGDRPEAFFSVLPGDDQDKFLYRDKALTGEEFFLAVKSDPDLPKALLCHDYCEKLLGSCELCKTCLYYKGHVNDSIDLQYSLLKYMLSSQDNLLSVKGDLKYPKRVFKGYVDLTLTAHGVLYPLPAPMLLYIYNAMVALGSNLYAESSVKSRLMCLKDEAFSLLVRSSRTGKYDAVNTFPAALVEQCWSPICRSILGSKDMTLADAQAFIANDGKSKKKNPVRIMDELDGLPPIEDRLFDSTAHEEEFSEVRGIEVSAAVAGDASETASKPDTESSILSESTDDVANGGSVEAVSSDVENNDAGKVPSPELSGNQGSVEDGNEPDVGHEDSEAEININVDDPLYLPACSNISFSNPKGLDRDYLFSSFIPVEIFDSGASGFCFVFLLKDNFYVCRPDSPKVSEIMGNKKVVKICWQPFDVYSLCVEYGVSIKSLYSILENELTYFNEPASASYWTVCSKYVDTLPLCSISDRYVVGMQHYKEVYANQVGMTRTRTPVSEKLHSYFEVLGRSYYRSRSLRDEGRLFSMTPLGRIKFNREYNFDVLHAGYEVSVIVDGLKDASETELFVNMLTRFGTKRFNGLQLVSINRNALILYVPGYMYEYVSSYIYQYLDMYAVRTGNMNMHVNFSSFYHDPDSPERTKYRPSNEPVSLTDALDYLASKKEYPGEFRISLDALGAMISSRNK